VRVGIDLGGTTIRVGSIDGETLRETHVGSTPSGESKETVLKKIFELVDRLPTEEVESIGAGVPSVVDVEAGIAYDVQNIPSWTEVRLKERIEARYGVPAHIQNDANCFALAEHHFGSGQGRSPMVGMIVGTGFAGGIVVDGALLSGQSCGAGESGTVPYRDSIYKHYCSGQFFEREYDTTAERTHERATENEGEAQAMFDTFGTHLGRAVQLILYTVDPAHIVMGGSVRHAYPFFKEAMWREIETFAFPRAVDALTLEKSTLEHAGVLGAAALGIQPGALP
jgi:Transcriptional regulator/sugar kinase